jgi:hypothetical protein
VAGIGGISNITVFCSSNTRRTGEPCRGAALKGSVPPRCRQHIARGKKFALARYETGEVSKAAETHSKPVPITAADALSADIDRSNGLILYYEGLLAQQDGNSDVIRAMLNAERAHAHKLSTTALAQKVDEKRALLFESTVDKMADAIERIVSDLGHNPQTEHVREIIARHLSRFTVQPGDPVTATVLEDWELAYDDWARERGNLGPLSGLEWDGEITDAEIVTESTSPMA